jgi:hypothetical protein
MLIALDRRDKIIPSNTMRFRKLRSVWSAGCGIVCLLLIALWLLSLIINELGAGSQTTTKTSRVLIEEGFYRHIQTLLPAMLFAAAALAPWFPYRFSLRTLLIVTTLVAVLLGAVIWAVR